MRDPDLLLSILSLVWMITVGLFIYIIKAKDKGEENTKNILQEIKTLISGISVDIATMDADLKNNVNNTKQVITRVDKHNDLLHKLEIKVTDYLAFKKETERRLTIVEKIIHNKE